MSDDLVLEITLKEFFVILINKYKIHFGRWYKICCFFQFLYLHNLDPS